MHGFPFRLAAVAAAAHFWAGVSVCHAQAVPDSTASSEQSASEQPPPEPQPPRKRRDPSIGADVEVLHFFSSRTRARFGSTIVSLGPGLGRVTPPLNGKLDLDLAITSASERQGGGRNKLFLLSIGPEYRSAYIPSSVRRAIREAQASQAGAPPEGALPEGVTLRPPPLLPYYGASLNAIYANIESPGDGIDGSGFGAGGSVFVGVAIKRRAFVEARLRATTRVKGFNLSGAGLTFGLRF